MNIDKIKKIAFIMPYHLSEKTGGAEVQAWFLAKSFHNKKFLVRYICRTLNRHKFNSISITEDIEVNWLPFIKIIKIIEIIYFYTALKKYKPDIIIQRNSSYLLYASGLYSKKYKTKFIWINSDKYSPFKWMHTKKSYISKKNKYIYILKLPIYLIKDFIRQRGIKYVTNIFVQNNYQKKMIIKNYGIIPQIINSGHPIPPKITPFEEKKKCRIILWSGNFGNNKRPGIFIKLARFFQYENNLRFIMIGSPSQRKYLKSLINISTKNLFFLGKINFDENIKWFDKAFLVINTSISEGFPNIFVQSWLRGVPVLTIGVDPDNIIRRYELGYVCKNLNELKNMIKYLLIDTEKYITLSKNARIYAEKNHNINLIANNLIEKII